MAYESLGIDKQQGYFSEEKTLKWLQARWGKFSGSEVVDLMTPGKTPKGASTPNMFSDAGQTLIKRIAIERFTGFHEVDRGMSLAMKRGKLLEPRAFSSLKSLIGEPNLVHHGGDNPVFIPYGEDAGSSPDAALYDGNGKILLTGEIKCREDVQHWDYLEWMREKGESLKGIHLADYNFADYCQNQMAILASGAEFALYINFNEDFPIKRRTAILQIDKDLAWQAKFKIRLKEAVKRVNNMVELQRNNYY